MDVKVSITKNKQEIETTIDQLDKTIKRIEIYNKLLSIVNEKYHPETIN